MNSFEKILDQNYNTMFRVAKKMVNDYDAGSDIVQEVFISLYNNLNNGNHILHPQSWLYRATSNKCIDYLKKQKRFLGIESIKDTKAEDEQIERTETNDLIHLAISKLKPRERMLAVFYSEGLSYKEMAKATGIRFSSIGKMLSRTLKKLEKELKKQNYELY